MKILLVLMCYIKYLSGYISYFDAGYFLIFSDMLPLLGSKGYCGFHSHSVFLRTCGITRFLFASHVRFSSYFYTSRYVTEGLLPLWYEWTRPFVVVRWRYGTWRGISQTLLYSYLFTSQCSSHSVFFSMQYLFFFLRNYKLSFGKLRHWGGC
jgi:hypothetical protein